MSDKNNKKTKDEFTSLLLGNDQEQQKTVATETDQEADAKTKVFKTSILGGQKKDGQTEKITPAKTLPKKLEVVETTKSIAEAPKQKPNQENFFNKDNLDPSLFSLEAALKQSEYLRMAQAKIKDLETSVNELSKENQTLSASAIVLQKKYDQQLNVIDNLKLDQKNQNENLKDELALKDKIIHELEKEKEELQRKNEEYKAITGEKIQQTRVRERELQNRLEILQHEGDVVITSKDETILDLKKQIDQLHFEIDNFKTQSRELNHELQEQKDQMRRSIKALRLALSLLENESLKVDELKKTGT